MEDAYQDCLLVRAPLGHHHGDVHHDGSNGKGNPCNEPCDVHAKSLLAGKEVHETSWNNQQPRLLQANLCMRDISTAASHWQFCLNTTSFAMITSAPKTRNPGYHRRWHRRPAVQWPSTRCTASRWQAGCWMWLATFIGTLWDAKRGKICHKTTARSHSFCSGFWTWIQWSPYHLEVHQKYQISRLCASSLSKLHAKERKGTSLGCLTIASRSFIMRNDELTVGFLKFSCLSLEKPSPPWTKSSLTR